MGGGREREKLINCWNVSDHLIENKLHRNWRRCSRSFKIKACLKEDFVDRTSIELIQTDGCSTRDFYRPIVFCMVQFCRFLSFTDALASCEVPWFETKLYLQCLYRSIYAWAGPAHFFCLNRVAQLSKVYIYLSNCWRFAISSFCSIVKPGKSCSFLC